jgi:hypothetical protein
MPRTIGSFDLAFEALEVRPRIDRLGGGRARPRRPSMERKSPRCSRASHVSKLIFKQTSERQSDRCRESCCGIGNVLRREATLLRGEGLAALTPGKRFVDMLGVSAEFETNLP